ncbi:MAG: xanthine dehydrogenase family protein molybdopterin-binding subunit, partial [Dehalococcoidia bacterium]|nr:xanthine dehydrogenase family protein molybdopterin-binding subunit [Dehalococcoidia bacterium]
MEPQLTLIGSRFPRLDARRKASGEAKYGADVSLHGLLYGAVLRSPLPHARVLHVDASKAERLPGVKAVLIPQDVPPIRIGMCKRDEPVLADGKVRHAGEAVAAVAAVDEDTAEEALSLIRVEYEPLPAVFDPEQALRGDAPWIHEEGNIADHFAFERGDMEAGLRDAELIVEERFDVSCVQHCFLEPLASVASFDSSGRLSIWSNLKSPFRLRKEVARTLSVPESSVRVILTEIGGEFGGKGQTRIASVCMLALLARKAAKPIKMVCSREEEFLAGTNRTPAVLWLRIGATREGRLTFKEAKIIADSGAYCKAGPWVLSTMAIRPDSLYRLPNLRTEATLAYTNNCPIGQYRGFGNTEGTFALESMMDMVAGELGMDPVELRLR